MKWEERSQHRLCLCSQVWRDLGWPGASNAPDTMQNWHHNYNGSHTRLWCASLVVPQYAFSMQPLSRAELMPKEGQVISSQAVRIRPQPPVTRGGMPNIAPFPQWWGKPLLHLSSSPAQHYLSSAFPFFLPPLPNQRVEEERGIMETSWKQWLEPPTNPLLDSVGWATLLAIVNNPGWWWRSKKQLTTVWGSGRKEWDASGLEILGRIIGKIVCCLVWS